MLENLSINSPITHFALAQRASYIFSDEIGWKWTRRICCFIRFAAWMFSNSPNEKLVKLLKSYNKGKYVSNKLSRVLRVERLQAKECSLSSINY